jgi:AcrR family transcriptional regulator
VFAERGTDAPLDEVARRAGIGNATMYRHFPTRGELIIAVYADEVTALCAAGETLSADHPPDTALREWLDRFITHVATKRELAVAIPQGQNGERPALFERWHTAMRATASALLGRAQHAGTASLDVAASDLLALATGIAVTSNDPQQTQRCLTLILRSLNP